MSDRTPLPQQEIPGWYIEWQSSVLQQLPRPPEMDKVTVMRWKADQRELKQTLRKLVTPPKVELSDKRFSILDTFDIIFDKTAVDRNHEIRFCDPHYFMISDKLKHGQKLKVDIVVARGMVSVDDGIEFLRREEALFLGDLGGILVVEEQARLAKGNMRIPLGNRWIASFGPRNIIDTRPEQERTVPGILGPEHNNYDLKSMSVKELNRKGLFLIFCFRDAS